MSPMSPPSLTTRELKASYETIYQEHGIRDHPVFYDWIFRLVRPRAGEVLLDIACGEGDLVAVARRAGVWAYGLDLSERALHKARGHAPNLVAIVGNAEQLPCRSNHFAVVTCLGSLENMLRPEAALAEVHRVLRDDGRACFVMPNKFWLGDVLEVMWKGDEATPFQAVEREGTCHQWSTWLLANGFQVERVLRYNKRPNLFVGHKLKSVRKFLWRSFFNAVCPFFLSWSFVYLCRKIALRPSAASLDASCYWQLQRTSDLVALGTLS